MKQIVRWTACAFVAVSIFAPATLLGAAHAAPIDLSKYDRPGEPTWAQILAAPKAEPQRRFPHLQGRQ